jgi:esterase/lipase superfamily enzyme
MELLVFGHGGARVIVFPTSNGRFYDWENRGMIGALQRHIDNGWVQLYCVDSVDGESWFNHHASPTDKARRHLQYQDYIIEEVLPFTRSKNDNPFVIAAGASFGAYHSASIAVRYPKPFNRVIGMSGVYDVRDWTGGYMDEVVKEGSPCEYLAALNDPEKIADIRKLDWIIPIGNEDPLFGNNQWFSQLLWDKGVWHAFRVWDGFAHDWPQWYEMIQHYIGGPDTRG